MTYSLLLNTPRLSIVGINEINLSQVIEYYQVNHKHLINGGGFVPFNEKDIRALYDSWMAQTADNTLVRFFIMKNQYLIGSIGLSNITRGAFHAAYVGYHLAEHEVGKGYMTEALAEVIEFAFDGLNLHRLMANYQPTNLQSGRVLEKLNFEREGFAKKYLLINGEWRDHILTSLTNDNWQG